MFPLPPSICLLTPNSFSKPNTFEIKILLSKAFQNGLNKKESLHPNTTTLLRDSLTAHKIVCRLSLWFMFSDPPKWLCVPRRLYDLLPCYQFSLLCMKQVFNKCQLHLILSSWKKSEKSLRISYEGNMLDFRGLWVKSEIGLMLMTLGAAAWVPKAFGNYCSPQPG